MPTKPKRPCAYPGCPALSDGRYCPEHQKLVSAQYERYQRDPATRGRYDPAWRRLRARFLAAYPLCAHCREQGRITPATEVHHILPLSRGGTNDAGNLKALCKPCHSRVSAIDGDRWRR